MSETEYEFKVGNLIPDAIKHWGGKKSKKAGPPTLMESAKKNIYARKAALDAADGIPGSEGVEVPDPKKGIDQGDL